MDTMLNSLPHLLLGIGLVLLIIELLMGFSTVLLLTLGLSFLVTSGLMFAGELDHEWLRAVYSIAVVSVLLTIVLWRPIKKLQADREPNEVKSDWIGTTFDLESDVSPGQPGTARFSGVNWQVRANAPLAKGQQVKIVKVEVGTLYVDAV
ncbi:NfeD family protein [Alteromonas halophila]|uniref:NfeD-like C-terminal domain-containing protein n=1 Tax=Alteromonas halophila TaxID=516698 RepID=A0A918JDG9_9ALTE|nr:NfeD family protein [Alteromonas halophila]GGW75797.1 hypothetical protein GCM10007391_05220 [Alteromonas halophila]